MGTPNRKKLRLSGYDYSENGAYFITICTEGKKHLFGKIIGDSRQAHRIVGADSISAQGLLASKMVCNIFDETINQYDTVTCPIYVLMPNHFHAIIEISKADIESAPTIAQILQSFKRHCTLEYIKLVNHGTLPRFEKRIWQRSYNDRIIRDQREYLQKWQYIEENPLKWEEDEYYT